MSGPLKFTSCVIGRKFSHRHCRRALCCRLQDFRADSKRGRYLSKTAQLGKPRLLPPPTTGESQQVPWDGNWPKEYSIHHPTLLSTCVKFDDKVLSLPTTNEEADAPASNPATTARDPAGANFSEVRCLAWLPGGPNGSTTTVVDGSTGTVIRLQCPSSHDRGIQQRATLSRANLRLKLDSLLPSKPSSQEKELVRQYSTAERLLNQFACW